MKKKKRSLFRKDFFDIKERIFIWKLRKSLWERNHYKADQLKCLLDIATLIGIPRNADEVDKLKWVCVTYDELMSELNFEMNQVKERLEEEFCFEN